MIPQTIKDQVLVTATNSLDLRRSISQLKSKYNLVVTGSIVILDTHIAICSTGTRWQNEAYVTHWHPDQMIVPDEENRVVTEVVRDGNMWKLQKAIVPKISDQDISFCNDADSLTDYIKKQWSKGFDLTDIAFNNGQYLVVTSQGLNYIQSWIVSDEMPVEKMKLKIKEGSILTNVIKFKDSYLWLFSANTGYNDMLINYDPDYDELIEIREKLVTDEKYDGYTLSLVKEYKRLLLLVFHK